MEPTYRIRFFFDYGSGICLWSGNRPTEIRFGYPITPEQLGLSPRTCAEAERLIAWYDRSLDWSNPPEGIPWSADECHAFNAAMQQLRTTIGHELGEDYTLANEQPDIEPDREAPC